MSAASTVAARLSVRFATRWASFSARLGPSRSAAARVSIRTAAETIHGLKYTSTTLSSTNQISAPSQTRWPA